MRTLNDTNNKGNHKLQQIAIGCDKYLIDIVALQEHRLKITDGNEINYQKLNGWTLAHTSSSQKSRVVAILYNERVSKALINIARISERVIAAHLHGNPRVCVIFAYAYNLIEKKLPKLRNKTRLLWFYKSLSQANKKKQNI